MSNNPFKPKLVFVGEPFDGRICELNSEKTTVGRASANHLCIQDASVSAHHCEIFANGAEVLVHDLNSSNGTFVNAVRVAGQTQLKHGQIVRFGNVNARLDLAENKALDNASEVTAVHLHARMTREAKQERENPAQQPRQVTLGAGENAPASEHTVTIPAPRPAPAAPQFAPATGAPAPRSSGRRTGLFLFGVILGAAIVWWLVRK